MFLPPVTLDGNRLWKNGEYDKVNNCINWTVTVNNPSASDLNKYVVTDTLESGKIIGDVTLSVQQDSKGEWHNPNVKIATITDAKDQSAVQRYMCSPIRALFLRAAPR